jgi:hypothetical protein
MKLIHKITSVQTSFLLWNCLIFKITFHLCKYDSVPCGIVKKWLSILGLQQEYVGRWTNLTA